MRDKTRPVTRRVATALVCALALSLAGGCSLFHRMPDLASKDDGGKASADSDYNYIIGAGDELRVFVWRNPELSSSVAVRPDGKFSSPLVEDLQASGKTPSALAREIEKRLGDYIRDPLVTVTIERFVGESDEQIRVVGEAARPQTIPYRKNMTVLDALIATGGLTQYAAGNRASIVRHHGGDREQYRVYLDDLIKGGDIKANVEMMPGDILIIPETWF